MINIVLLLLITTLATMWFFNPFLIIFLLLTQVTFEENFKVARHAAVAFESVVIVLF